MQPMAQTLEAALQCQKSGQLNEAERLYRYMLTVEPEHLDALHLLGYVLTMQGRLDDAVAVLRQVTVRDPASAVACFNLARALHAQQLLEEAAGSYRSALLIAPGLAAAHSNLGAVLLQQGKVSAAVAATRRAVELDPRMAEFHHNLASALRERGELTAALGHNASAVELNPESAEFHYSYAMALLELGDFERGWREYEWRFGQKHNASIMRDFSAPAWRGEALAGKSLLVWGEQGVGDEIHFASMIPELVEQSHQCVVECSAKLVPLLQHSFPAATVVARTSPADSRTRTVDVQSALGSIARWRRPTLTSFPLRASYLQAPPGRIAYWRERLHALGAGMLVGFSWRSSNLNGRRALACTTLNEWGPIFAVPGVCFINLQYDECMDELNQARSEFGVMLHHFPEVDMFNDLNETAALMKALDLVISAPTTVSIQAAALGLPCWQMSYGADWQAHGTEHNPWYPTMKCFQRKAEQSWSEIIEQIASEVHRVALTHG